MDDVRLQRLLRGAHRRGSDEPCPQTSARDREASRVPKMYPRRTRVLRGQATRNAYLQVFRRSPLTDSNRRPRGVRKLCPAAEIRSFAGDDRVSHLRAGRTRRASAQRVSRSVSVFSRSTAEPGVRRDETPQCPPRSSVARRGLGFKVSSSAPWRAGCKKRRRRLERDLWGCANSVLPANSAFRPVAPSLCTPRGFKMSVRFLSEASYRVATITCTLAAEPASGLVVCQGRGAAPASSRYGERLLTDPDDRLCNPLLGEPAANAGEELGDLRRRRRALVVEIPATVAPLADSAAVAPQSLGE